MADGKNLESWLRKTGESPEIQELARRAEAGHKPSDSLLAAYEAGMLKPEDAERVGNAALFSIESGKRLIALREDEEAAELLSKPETPSLRTRLGDALAGLFAPKAAYAFATGAAAVAVLLVGVQQIGNRPPGFPSDPYAVVTDGAKGVERLPDGTTVSVDDAWTLFTPVGDVKTPRWFAWQPVDGAATYSLRLLGPGGELVFGRSGIGDTHVRLPDEERNLLRPRRDYAWVVDALGSDGAVVSRGVGRFRVEPD